MTMTYYVYSVPRLVCLAVCATSAAFAQVAQDHPELCGRASVTVSVPPGVTLRTYASYSRSELRIQDLNRTIVFPGIMESVQQVCPIPHDGLAVFGLGTPALYNIELVRLIGGSLLDSFYGYSPIMAANQRWLARRKFYPAHSVGSEEYMIYDLSEDWAHNRQVGIERSDMDLVGRVMYPVVAGGWPFYNVNLPADQTHTFRADSFYWAPDSQGLLFADSVQQQLSLVFVSLEHDQIRAFVHPLTDVEACPGSVVTFPPILTSADISLPVNGRREIHANFKTGNSVCTGMLTLQSDDFKPASPEIHTPPWGAKISAQR